MIGSPYIFKMVGWNKINTIVLEKRTASILLLFCSAVIAGFSYWYPWYLATYYFGPDDRYGMVMVVALPVSFIGACMAGVSIIQLLSVVLRKPWSVKNGILGVCGGLLALIGLSPLFMLGRTFLSR